MIKTNQSKQCKKYSKSCDWMDKSRPSKKAAFDHVIRLIMLQSANSQKFAVFVIEIQHINKRYNYRSWGGWWRRYTSTNNWLQTPSFPANNLEDIVNRKIGFTRLVKTGHFVHFLGTSQAVCREHTSTCIL